MTTQHRERRSRGRTVAIVDAVADGGNRDSICGGTQLVGLLDGIRRTELRDTETDGEGSKEN